MNSKLQPVKFGNREEDDSSPFRDMLAGLSPQVRHEMTAVRTEMMRQAAEALAEEQSNVTD